MSALPSGKPVPLSLIRPRIHRDCADKDEIKGIADVAEDNDITIISDEVYEHFIYEGEHVSPGSSLIT